MDSTAHYYCFTVCIFFYTLNAHVLWHSKCTLGDPTLSSQGLHMLTKIVYSRRRL